ncbi:DUF305 domain-containing protein [Nocardioides sp. S-58]|uniref:DUF305 domain-containing protein n=1 Tax=Nocardioides renjunii TaxID=3095075 RepID=A0ABU5KGL7_9ACTN|nr:DUF305 domain-containing protein [Nocardioides sp. S-58]MDZ5663983.1 DUF305 domain-containing protein [Nocardioides sp. S-58]
MTPSRRTWTGVASRSVALLLCLAATGCTGDEQGGTREEDAPPVVQLGAPGEPGTTLSPDEVEDLEDPAHTEADVTFVQDMIPHHAQALEMTALAEQRAADPDLATIAERIEVSQVDELDQLRGWLAERDETLSGTHGEHGSDDHGEHGSGTSGTTGHAGMPGMATPEELEQLAEAQGRAFDRLFLQLMIRHHEGAIIMVETLLAGGEGGQESAVFQLASHIASDQAVEIAAMKRELTQGE